MPNPLMTSADNTSPSCNTVLAWYICVRSGGSGVEVSVMLVSREGRKSHTLDMSVGRTSVPMVVDTLYERNCE